MRRILPESLARLAYRVGYRLLSLIWMVTRPRRRGAKVAVVRDGREVLLIRHTYGPASWDLPGGTARSAEDPAATAARELDEELGLRGALEPVGCWRYERRRARGSLYGFRLDVDSTARIESDPIEIAQVSWCALDDPPDDLADGCEAVLAYVRSL